MAVDVALGNRGARQHFDIVCIKIVCIDAVERQVGCLCPVLGLSACQRGGKADIFDGVRIAGTERLNHLVCHEILVLVAAHKAALLIGLGLQHHDDVAGAERAHLAVDGVGQSAAHRKNADDRADADDDAEHGEKRAHFARAQSLPGKADIFAEIHTRTSPPVSTPSRMV